MAAGASCVDNANDYDESRPLLITITDDGEQQTLAAHPNHHRRSPTPLPNGQLLTLCALRLADPIAFTQVFPYVNEMMENFGVATNPSQTGFYSGLVESVFAFSQLISIYQWAAISDRIGRRPVVLAGTVGIAITTILFGFSRTLTTVLFARSLAGVFSGNVAVMHSVLGELTDSTNQALAYSIYGLCWPIGVIVGPLIGGTFSNPAQKFPRLFDSEVFRIFPYLLPCLIVAASILVAVVVGFWRLDETLPSKKRLMPQREYSISYGIAEHRDNLLSEQAVPSSRSLMRLPVMRAICLSGFALSFVGTAFDVVFILFCYSPVASGGLSFSVSQIGYALAVAGVSSAGFQIIFMPALLRIFSCSHMYKLCMGIWPFTFLFLPLLNWTAQMGHNDFNDVTNNDVRAILWIGIGVTLVMSRIACLAFSLNMILVKENAPGPSSLGTANGLAQFSQCLARAIAPAFVSCLFAFSIDYNLLGGHLWVIVMAAVSSLACIHASTVFEDNGDIDINKSFDSI